MIPYELYINETAKIDMKKNYRYIVKNFSSYIVADRIIAKINNKILILKHYPHMYPILYNHKEKVRKYRRIIIGNYSIIYYILEKQKKVVIIHIFYNKRKFFNS